VSFTASGDATRHLPVVAALEAAIPDAAALVFACLGIALAVHGRRALRARALNLASVGTSLAEQRLGHQVPGMRGLYAHASQRMRDELTADLQSRWGESLRERAAIDPHSTVPLLDTLLAPFRTEPARETISHDTISQIPPNTATAPIRQVGWEP
jgi:hypothetical protein